MKTKGLETITPIKVGVDPRSVRAFLNRIEEGNIHLHSFMMLKGDKVFAKGSCAPCKADDLHMLFSMSKSFTSTAVGFAVQEGRLKLTDKVVDYFKEEIAGQEEKVCQNMKEVTVRHLLTMNTGQTNPEDGLFEDFRKDWCLSFLTSPVEKEPGSWFLYNTRSTYILSAILQKLTGQGLLAYLKPRLFEPLGFSKETWWEQSPQGIAAGGFGLNISVEDLAKFGIFVKNRGMFNGKQLLSRAWFEEATRCWSDTSNTWEGENAYGYGYQFWMCHIPGVYRGDGAFGQYCVIMPDEDMLFVTTAGELNMQKILDAFWETVYAGVRSGAVQGGSNLHTFQQELEAKLKKMTLPAYYEEKGIQEKCIQLPETIWGKEYVLEENALHISALRLIRIEGEDDRCLLELKNGKNRDNLTVSAQEWVEGRLHLDGDSTELEKAVFRAGLYSKCYVKGCTKDNVFYLDMLFHETSFQDTWEIVFREREILLNIKRNTGFVPVDIHVKGIWQDSIQCSA